MADFPPFAFTTQEDWYGELSFFSAEDKTPVSLAGRSFVMLITPAQSGAGLIEPVITLTMEEGRGLSFKGGESHTLAFRVPRSTATKFPRGEFTGDILEVVGSERYLFMPVRITYAEPSVLRAYSSRFVGVSVSFAARQQPIYTPLAVPGAPGSSGATIITDIEPPTPLDGKDGDFFIEDRSGSGRSRLMYGPKAGGVWPTPPWSIQAPGTHTPVADADYQGLPTDEQIGLVALTAPRTISLPDVDSFPLGRDIVIADESGACSDTLTITIQPGAGTGDVIGGPDGATNIVLFTPYQAARFRRGAANLWIRL
ncbi:hypothetical protein PUR23_26855 [Methylorubrum populi]|uniref:hypothetical protein n=1 Tax=Methylorubrum populi TaxID=223967 RepID=UPI0031F76D95